MDRIRVLHPAAPGGTALWAPVSGDYTAGLGDYLLQHEELGSPEDFGRVRAEASRILGRCLPPGPPDGRRTGLVIGYVQSGKTLSMTCLSALARDNGFRIVVVISGTTDILYGQSRERFEKHLRGGAASREPWVMLANPTAAAHHRTFHTLVSDWRDQRVAPEDQRCLFITVMKNYRHLENLSALLGQEDLRGIDALVIDDEADQASLNTRPGTPTPSTTYTRLRQIRDRLPKHTFLQYTATAQAIILISLLDMLSPDFADVLETSPDYTGGRAFFVDRQDLVEDIPPAQLPAQVIGDIAPPASLIRALRFFFLGVAANRIRRFTRPISMLVHPDRLTAQHPPYRTWIEQTMDRWVQVLRLPADDPERVALVAEFVPAYGSLSASAGPLPTLDELLDRLAIEIPRTLAWEVNSATGSEVIWDNAAAHILVGGDKLNRGYTVKGLTVTYMPRPGGTWTADTIQQRARFLGYKRPYLGYCRVFLEQRIREAYEDYVEHEENLRQRVLVHRDLPTKRLRRAFVLDRSLRPTRQTVLTDPYFRFATGDGWFRQSAPHIAGDVPGNVLSARALVSDLQFEAFPPYPHHRIAREVPLQRVLEFLGDFAFAERETLEAHVTVLDLLSLLERDAAATVAVIEMGSGNVRERTVRPDDDTFPLFQGAGGGGYPGDEAMLVPDRPTLQLHWIRVFSNDPAGGRRMLVDQVPAVAIRIPGNSHDWLIQRTRRLA